METPCPPPGVNRTRWAPASSGFETVEVVVVAFAIEPLGSVPPRVVVVVLPFPVEEPSDELTVAPLHEAQTSSTRSNPRGIALRRRMVMR